jgi:hypothetical protein
MIRANRMGQLGSALGSPDAISVMGNVVGSHAKQDEDLLVKGLTAREGMNTRKEISANTNALKATIAAMQEGGKDRRFTPYSFSGNALTGRTRGNKATGEADYTEPTAKPVDPNARGRTKLIYDEKGNGLLLDMDTGETRPTSMPTGGGPVQREQKKLGPKEVGQLSTFDAAEERLGKMEALFRKGVGTYPGASTLHDVASVAGVADPEFDQLRALSKSHLFKGLKSDIGGRITNFEIQYGKDMFPNEGDRPEQALAKVALIRDVLRTDKQNLIDNLAKSGVNMKDLDTGGVAGPAKDLRTRAAELRKIPGMTKEKFAEILKSEGYEVQ